MKKISSIFYLFLFTGAALYSQGFTWNANLYTFFDNVEFGGSAYKIPQTMAGGIFTPGASITLDSVHGLHAGVSLIREFGSEKVIDKIDPVIYYSCTRGNLEFMMGAFPRMAVVGKYPRMFFQDSLSYYRPNINGISVRYSVSKSYLSLWLDWTGRQSYTTRESFLAGMSGRYTRGMFYIQNFAYMFHLAGSSNPADIEGLHDNLLFQASAGIDLSGKTILDVLDFNAGWVAGIERERNRSKGFILRDGFLAETRIGYGIMGFFNTFYTGSGLMEYYTDHGDELYWGDPAYRAATYNRSDLSLRFFRNRKVDIGLTYSLHFLEREIYNEQLLKVKVDINNL
jgi:hypothetical protein